MGNSYQKNFSLQREKTINSHDVVDIVLIANDYIISNPEGMELEIFDFKKKLTKKIKYNSPDYIIKFHPKYENVFLFADINIMKIIEITKDEFELKKNHSN